jgi:phosphohistidine phosphatase
MGLKFDLILSSPLLRAKETAEMVATGLKLKKRLKFSAALTPEKSTRDLITQLQKLKPLPEKILLVGYEPFLSRLISRLISGGETVTLAFKKGGLGKLEVKNLRAEKCATLAWLLTPKQMKLMQ